MVSLMESCFKFFLHDYDKSETANDTRCSQVFEFSLIVFSDKNICHHSKGFKPAISCVRYQDANIMPDRHMREVDLEIDPQFMLHSLIRFPKFNEFLFLLGKTPLDWITSGMADN